MPTENRSSTIEQHDHIEGIIDMVSVPREWLNSVALLQMPLDKLQEQAIQHLCEPCDEPAPQPHPEPIAWMVGTAIWWTREEAERDAAATGLPIVGLGPMTDAAEVELLREALKFYADRDHFAEDIGSEWDSVSGEPANVLWHEDEAWFVEDGSIARAALERRPEKKSI